MSVGEGRRIFFEIDSVLTEMMTVKQAAYHYNYSFRTIQKWIDEGKIIAIKVEGKNWLKKKDLDKRIMTR